jgi:hypothetical protein
MTVESKIVSPVSMRRAGIFRSGLRLSAKAAFGRPGTTSAYSSAMRSIRWSSMAAALTFLAKGDCGA